MLRFRNIAVVLGALGFFSSLAQASPIAYSESVSGDLPASTAITVFTLDAGANTVSGRFGVIGTFDFDSFAFIVPAGMSMSGGSVVLADSTGNMDFSTWSLNSGSVNYDSGTFITFIAPDSPGVAGIPALGEGTYNMSHLTFNAPVSSSSTYTFTLNVVAPEPASVGVLGLGSLGLLRRRRGGLVG